MRHLKKGRHLKRTESHRKALLCNLAASLIRSEQKAIRTTVAKAKELRPFVERLITKARRAYQRERAGQLPSGSTIDLHTRRLVARYIRDEAVLQELFDVVAPIVAERNGGYTRIVKLGFRRGDGAQEAIIQLVDWSAPQDGARTLQRRQRRRQRGQDTQVSAPTATADVRGGNADQRHESSPSGAAEQTIAAESSATAEHVPAAPVTSESSSPESDGSNNTERSSAAGA